MTFYPSPHKVPSLFQTAEFQLQPLTPAHVKIDYAAVMASRKMLNLWSGSQWPTPGFTLAENLADLEWHDREHRERIAFTYTILDPGGSACLGCLYIRPLSELAEKNPGALKNCSPAEAMARFWILSSHVADGLDHRVLMALIDWFDKEWDFPQISLHTRLVNEQQVDLFDASTLTHRFDLQMPQRGGIHRFWSNNALESKIPT